MEKSSKNPFAEDSELNGVHRRGNPSVVVVARACAVVCLHFVRVRISNFH